MFESKFVSYTALSWVIKKIYYANLFLLLGIFNPFIFNVITNKVGLLPAIFLLVFYIFASFFLLLLLLLSRFSRVRLCATP